MFRTACRIIPLQVGNSVQLPLPARVQVMPCAMLCLAVLSGMIFLCNLEIGEDMLVCALDEVNASSL